MLKILLIINLAILVSGNPTGSYDDYSYDYTPNYVEDDYDGDDSPNPNEPNPVILDQFRTLGLVMEKACNFASETMKNFMLEIRSFFLEDQEGNYDGMINRYDDDYSYDYTPNYVENDPDGDGIANDLGHDDFDNDGIPDDLDYDDDNDGIPDELDSVLN